MVCFLASSPTRELEPSWPVPILNESNGFVEQLRRFWKEDACCLMIAAEPDAYDLNDEMTNFYAEAVKNTGFSFACFDLWDSRLPGLSKEEFDQYDVIFLAGGHVPTQRDWFRYIGLTMLLESFDGILIGTSAGSMNAARLVYAWPEREGESLDPDYELFFEGLGLAEVMILPHYQKVKDWYLDGKRLVEEIACQHSWGHRFLMIPDGSYVLAENDTETVFGEAYLLSDGEIHDFCEYGNVRVLSSQG